MNSFNPKKYTENIIKMVKKEIGDNQVLIAISGGVDSTVSTAILKKANIRRKVVFIDTGFLRKGEVESVLKSLKENMIKVELLKKRKIFHQSLKNKYKAEDKREAFKETYFKILFDFLKKNKIKYLVQGTQAKGSKIQRNYHNLLPKKFKKLKFKSVEPVQGLTKEQIRKIAKYFELTDEIVSRKPFPGPGLLIRFGGEYNYQKLDLIRRATFIVDNLIEKNQKNFLNCFQIFPYLCDNSPVVFIDKDKKTDLGHILIIRAVVKKKEKGGYLPFSLSDNIKQELIKKLMKLDKTARICFDCTPKYGTRNKIMPGATIEYE